MKKRYLFLIVILIVTVIVVLTVPYARSSTNLQPSVQKSVKIINGMKYTNFVDTNTIKLMESGLKKNEINEITNWMDKNPDRVVPWYWANMSDILYKDGQTKKAMEYFYRGLFRTFEDVYMCNDSYARNLPLIIRNMGQYTQAAVSKKNKNFQKNLMLNVLDWDEKTPRLAHPEWSCLMAEENHGIKSMNEYDRTIKESREALRKSINEQ